MLKRGLVAGWIGLAALLPGCGQEAPKAVEVRPVRTVVVDPKPSGWGRGWAGRQHRADDRAVGAAQGKGRGVFDFGSRFPRTA
jgi:hypothetical protein